MPPSSKTTTTSAPAMTWSTRPASSASGTSASVRQVLIGTGHQLDVLNAEHIGRDSKLWRSHVADGALGLPERRSLAVGEAQYEPPSALLGEGSEHPPGSERARGRDWRARRALL